MGLLDDAIREHLELKRRRGADPTEVEQLEQEALGPVRRGAQEPRDLAMQDSQAAPPTGFPDDELGYEQEWVDEAHEPGWAEPADQGAAFEPEPEAPLHHEIAEGWDAQGPLDPREPTGTGHAEPEFDDEPLTAEHPAAPPPPAGGNPPPAPAGPAGDAPPPAPASPAAGHPGEETVEYDVESEELAEGEEDVLEETPEFLQDTPDHDRLWFEQKPPRDFDFDS